MAQTYKEKRIVICGCKSGGDGCAWKVKGKGRPKAIWMDGIIYDLTEKGLLDQDSQKQTPLRWNLTIKVTHGITVKIIFFL